MELTRQELESAYVALEGPLYNFALRWVWNPALAQELVQDAFVRVWQSRARVERATLKPLLYKTVQNLALNERRRAKVRALTPLLDWLVGDAHSTGPATAAPGAEGELLLDEELRAAKAALEQLPEELRRVLLLCEFSDLTLEEAGRALGIPPGTVASRKNRALRKLREILHSDEEVSRV